MRYNSGKYLYDDLPIVVNENVPYGYLFLISSDEDGLNIQSMKLSNEGE